MSIEAMRQALDYLDAPSSKVWAAGTQYKIITALRAAIEQAEKQKPVVSGFIRTLVNIDKNGIETWKDEPYYTAPPQREWQNAALRIGEELSSVGPDGYYAMSSSEWLDWALAQNPKGKTSLQQREWQGLTHEEQKLLAYGFQKRRECVAMTEAKLKEKNAL